ncbi:hemolysin secretion protein D, chromosomal [mine drainage metagenome]|uniref:Hemolysin secretion protein D, chromosomal n=1 Tax=mine drainage metagenome TaxID=410659 RepID=A0A1J5QTR9_9ZZZZ
MTASKTAVEFLPDADAIEQRPLPLSARVTLHVCVLALTTFVIWATYSDIDLIVTAHGRLVTPLPNIVVQPLETSIIQSIDVRIGQVVQKGQRLAALDPTFSQADEAQLRTQLDSLNTQIEWMEAELSGKRISDIANADADSQLQNQLSEERRASYIAQQLKLEENIGRVRASMETNRHDQMALNARVTLLRQSAAIAQALVAEKYAVRTRFLDAQDRLLETERNLEMAKNHELELKKELAGLEAEKTSFETSWRQKTMEDLLKVTRDRDAVSEQLQKADRRHNLVVLTSPRDAVVLEIAKLSQGSVAQAAEKLFTLVPLDAKLEANVQIDAQDVGYVKTGDKCFIKFDAYPWQRHGTLPGTLRTISQDAFRRDSANASGPEAYYQSLIRLEATRLKKMPDYAKLLPGMTLTAEIVVGKRSVMSYLLWPLKKALDESVREP